MKLLKFNDYSQTISLTEEFLHFAKQDAIFESEENKSTLEKLASDLKLNLSIILSFGTGMDVFIPIVRRLCENGEIKVDLTKENLAMITLTAITIAYLEEVKNKEKKEILEKDSRSLLEELKLRGVGNGIIKKVVECIKSIGNLVSLIFKHQRSIIQSFFDMLGYAALCIPVLNSINFLISTHNWNLDTFTKNIASIVLGLASLTTKSLLNWLYNLADKAKGNSDDSNDDEEEKLIQEQ
jgi:hypothetical protein